MKSIYQSLLEFKELEESTEEGKGKIQDFLLNEVNEILPYAGKTPSVVFAHLKKALVESTKEHNQKVYNKHVVFFHCLFGIPLKHFDLNEKEALYIKLNSFHGKNVDIYQLKALGSNKENQEKKVVEYLQGSQKFLDYLNHNCFIYDYLERFSDEEDEYKQRYINRHEDIFLEIEKKLFPDSTCPPQFDYARFLALPRNMCEFDPHETFNKEAITEEVLEHCPLPLFKHIIRCLKRYPDYEKKDEYRNRGKNNIYHYGFYLVGLPTKEYHYSVIDNGNFCLTEYYRYNKDQVCKPDLLFVEDNKGSLSKLSENYTSEISTLLSEFKQPKLDLTTIESVLEKHADEKGWEAKVTYFKNVT